MEFSYRSVHQRFKETHVSIISKLDTLRKAGGKPLTIVLGDDVIVRFARQDNQLEQAVDDALAVLDHWRRIYPELVAADEAEQKETLQAGYVNFYADDCVIPYVALAARGSWIITSKGAVLHDSGGYGMLGMGHAPDAVLEAMNRTQVMANIMTPSFSHQRFYDALKKEIGQNRAGGSPFNHFLCMNSGSEAVTVGCRIADINTRKMTDPDGPRAGHKVHRLSLTGSFHGRTDRPARFSDSTRKTYAKHLASYRNDDTLITVEPNNIEHLEQAFDWADKNRAFIEAVFLEPVMGEGNPGMGITPEFYAAARRLTKEHGALLLIDSIQAGLDGVNQQQRAVFFRQAACGGVKLGGDAHAGVAFAHDRLKKYRFNKGPVFVRPIKSLLKVFDVVGFDRNQRVVIAIRGQMFCIGLAR